MKKKNLFPEWTKDQLEEELDIFIKQAKKLRESSEKDTKNGNHYWAKTSLNAAIRNEQYIEQIKVALKNL